MAVSFEGVHYPQKRDPLRSIFYNKYAISYRELEEIMAEREVPLHGILENPLDTALPTSGRLFPQLTVDRVVKRYAHLRRRNPGPRSTVFNSTRK